MGSTPRPPGSPPALSPTGPRTLHPPASTATARARPIPRSRRVPVAGLAPSPGERAHALALRRDMSETALRDGEGRITRCRTFQRLDLGDEDFRLGILL